MRGKRQYRFRWRVGGSSFERNSSKKYVVERLRTELLIAERAGADFDPVSGLPVEATPVVATSFVVEAQRFCERKWPDISARYRIEIAKALALAAIVFVDGEEAIENPDATHAILWRECFRPHPTAAVPADLEQRSLPVDRITVSDADRWVDRISRRQDGERVAKNTYLQRFRPVSQLFDDLVRRELVDRNPVRSSRKPLGLRTTSSTRGAIRPVVDVRTFTDVVRPACAEIAPRLAVPLEVIFFAGPRISEVVGLRWVDFDEAGSAIVFSGAIVKANKTFTDSGTYRDERPLKKRQPEERRRVPIPVSLTSMLSAARQASQPSKEQNFIFPSARGHAIRQRALQNDWMNVRESIWEPSDPRASLGLHGLRASAASWMLHAGLDEGEVARRLGHSIDVLRGIYQGHFSGIDERNRNLVEEYLALE